jgi:hypothetical protein
MDAMFAGFFLFLFKKMHYRLAEVLRGCCYENGNQTPPSTAVSSFSDETRSAVAGLRQSNSRLKPIIAAGEERDAK